MKKKTRKRLWLHQNKWLSAGGFCGSICTSCGEPLLMFDAYDALCCPRCDEWKEKQCSDPGCSFCRTRPESPSMALQLSDSRANADYFIHRYESRHKKAVRRQIKKDVSTKDKT